MESFNLNKHLADFYDNKPKTSQRPIIGITTNYEGIDATVRDRYYRQIIKAGGTPTLCCSQAAATSIRCGLMRSLRLRCITSTTCATCPNCS